MVEKVEEVETESYKRLCLDIEEWLNTGSPTGYFSLDNVYRIFNVHTSQGKKNAWKVLSELTKKDILEKHPSKRLYFRLRELEALEIPWRLADPKNTLGLSLPFGLEKSITIYPGTIGVVAGEKSTGKTAFANEFIKLNMSNPDLPQPIYLWSSEGSAEELNSRYSLHDIPIEDWTHIAKRRPSNFADVIKKDAINVVDFLRAPEAEYFRVGYEIDRISERLTTGFVLVLLQKDKGREFARGGGSTLDASRFYLTLTRGHPLNILTVVDVKSWRGQFNPNLLRIFYKLDQGTTFVKARETWKHETESEDL